MFFFSKIMLGHDALIEDDQEEDLPLSVTKKTFVCLCSLHNKFMT